MKEVGNVKEWLVSNGISTRWARSISLQIKKEYPALRKALEGTPNRAELEAVQLVHHIIEGRFPLRQ